MVAFKVKVPDLKPGMKTQYTNLTVEDVSSVFHNFLLVKFYKHRDTYMYHEEDELAVSIDPVLAELQDLQAELSELNEKSYAAPLSLAIGAVISRIKALQENMSE